MLLITHPNGGKAFDYKDYWDGDDLIYTGRGKVGDQERSGLNVLLDEWDDIQGWETFLPSSGRITQDDIRRAKKTVRPDLHDAINDGKRLAARLTEQIDRLGGMGEEKVASRLYTLLTGSS